MELGLELGDLRIDLVLVIPVAGFAQLLAGLLLGLAPGFLGRGDLRFDIEKRPPKYGAVQVHGVARLGFVDPMLYAIAARPQPVPGFHDITIGGNRYYPATRAWDFATGLGSPDVYNLAQDVVAYMKR
jgi:hypothetical protein